MIRKTDRLANALKNTQAITEIEKEACAFARKNMPYITVNPIDRNGNSYTFLINSKDEVMSRKMWGGYCGVQSEGELNAFFELTKKHYGIIPKDGSSFIDIGGNIGTTSVMVKKMYPKMNVTAFEPDKDNQKVFRSNCIMNDCDIELIGKALGEKSASVEMALSKENMGNHRIMNSSLENAQKEEIEMSTFDTEEEANIDKIDFVWMDVEGYEGHVLAGMETCLRKGHFPIWMEFNPLMLTESGGLDRVYSILPKYYKQFIDRHKPDEIKSIEELRETANEIGLEGKATDIFLIR